MAITLPDPVVYGLGIAILILGMIVITREGQIRGNYLAKTALKAAKGGVLAVVHYPSGRIDVEIPILENVGGKSAPFWTIGGTKRLKDNTGEKWESAGNLKLIHYFGRHPAPGSTNQAIAIDQLDDILADHGFSTKGIKKEVFFMITEAAKGPQAEAAAWLKLNVSDQNTIAQIQHILNFLDQNPDVRYQMFHEGVFTYQTAVSVIGQITAETVAEISDLISFIEDRIRRRQQDRFNDLMKYVLIALPVIIVSAIAAVVLLVGLGVVKVG